MKCIKCQQTCTWYVWFDQDNLQSWLMRLQSDLLTSQWDLPQAATHATSTHTHMTCNFFHSLWTICHIIQQTNACLKKKKNSIDSVHIFFFFESVLFSYFIHLFMLWAFTSLTLSFSERHSTTLLGYGLAAWEPTVGSQDKSEGSEDNKCDRKE